MRESNQEITVDDFTGQFLILKSTDNITYRIPLQYIHYVEFEDEPQEVQYAEKIFSKDYKATITLSDKMTKIIENWYYGSETTLNGKHKVSGITRDFRKKTSELKQIIFSPSIENLPEFGEVKLYLRDGNTLCVEKFYSFGKYEIPYLTKDIIESSRSIEDFAKYHIDLSEINTIEFNNSVPDKYIGPHQVWQIQITSTNQEKSKWYLWVYASDKNLKCISSESKTIEYAIESIEKILFHRITKNSYFGSHYFSGTKSTVTTFKGEKHIIGNTSSRDKDGKVISIKRSLSDNQYISLPIKALEFIEFLEEVETDSKNHRFRKIRYQEIKQSDWQLGYCNLDSDSFSGSGVMSGMSYFLIIPFAIIQNVEIFIVE